MAQLPLLFSRAPDRNEMEIGYKMKWNMGLKARGKTISNTVKNIDFFKYQKLYQPATHPHVFVSTIHDT